MSILQGLGLAAGSGAKAYLAQQEENRMKEEADRKKSEWARQDETRAGLEQRSKDAELTYTPYTGKTPADRDFEMAGYTLPGNPNEFYDADSGKRALAAYNAPEAKNQRIADYLVSRNDFAGAKDVQGLEASKIQLRAAKRDESKSIAQTAAEKDIQGLLDRSHGMTEGSPEHTELMQQVQSKVNGAFGHVKGMEYMKNALGLSEAKRTAEAAKAEASWTKAMGTEEGTIKKYNDDYKDGSTAKVVVGKDGVRQLVRVDADGNVAEPIGQPYKSWENGGMAQVAKQIPSLARKEYELGVAHKYKMEELDASKKAQIAYARELRADKKINMSPDQKAEFERLDKLAQEAKSPAEIEFAAKSLHSLSNRVAIANGQAPKSWSGFGAGKSEITAEALNKMVEVVSGDPSASKLSLPEKVALARRMLGGGTSGGGLTIPFGNQSESQGGSTAAGKTAKLGGQGRYADAGVPGTGLAPGFFTSPTQSAAIDKMLSDVTSGYSEARAKAIMPQIQAKLSAGLPLTEEEIRYIGPVGGIEQ